MNQVEIERDARIVRPRARTGGTAALRRLGAAVGGLCYAVAGLALLLALWWALAALAGEGLLGPVPALRALRVLVSDPFYDNGPNDKGIALQLAASLRRVFTGFAIGSLIAIPVGVLIGASGVARRLTDPIVQVLRPVSPLAWFPIGLAAFKAAAPATTFVIVITSLWPTMINTAFGVAAVPQDHKDVARVFRFGPWRYLTRVLLPYSLPHIITGLRLSMGIAWMVIVAAEMLSGGTGIGFFVWDAWNALSLPNMMAAILLIGGVGLLLDRGFYLLGRRFDHTG
jgi:nitrate/nitrite transport system permease protein